MYQKPLEHKTHTKAKKTIIANDLRGETCEYNTYVYQILYRKMFYKCGM